MKFTKKEIKDIKYYFRSITQILEINKIYENKNIIPEFIKINLINYGILTGRIKEIIHRRTNFKDVEKNLNADNLAIELFGEKYFEWVSKGHKDFINGNCIRNNNINNINNNDDKDRYGD